MAETKILYTKEVKTIIDVHLIHFHIRRDVAISEKNFFFLQSVGSRFNSIWL
jgi:hypothetical protein